MVEQVKLSRGFMLMASATMGLRTIILVYKGRRQLEAFVQRVVVGINVKDSVCHMY